MMAPALTLFLSVGVNETIRYLILKQFNHETKKKKKVTVLLHLIKTATQKELERLILALRTNTLARKTRRTGIFFSSN